MKGEKNQFELADLENKSSEMFVIENEPSNFVFYIEGKEMLRITPSGFFVKGKKTANDKRIYYMFREWIEKASEEVI